MAHWRVTSTGLLGSFSNKAIAGSTPGRNCGFFEILTAGLIDMACVLLSWMKDGSQSSHAIVAGEDAVSSRAAVRC